MKRAKTKEKVSKVDVWKGVINEIEQYVIFAYLFCMLCIFPLFYKEQYYKIGNTKFGFFWKTSILFILASFVFLLVSKLIQKVLIKKINVDGKTKKETLQKKSLFADMLEKLSFLDCAVLIYGICVCLSYAFSNYKDYAFKGASGWEMGLCSQLIFVALYFFLSKQEVFYKLFLGIHLLTSALVFVFGILHRFNVDPLGMYVGLNLNQKVEFLSTIGQATWFSSYVCTTFAIGLALFYVSKEKWIRVISGVYTVIAFGILVTQNSDSAFIAITGILLLLGYSSLSNIEKWCRFLQIVSFMWGTFAGIGVLQKVFADRAIPLDTLSVFFSQSICTWILLLASIGLPHDGKCAMMTMSG